MLQIEVARFRICLLISFFIEKFFIHCLVNEIAINIYKHINVNCTFKTRGYLDYKKKNK